MEQRIFDIFRRRPMCKAALGAWCGIIIYVLVGESGGMVLVGVALLLLLLSLFLCRRAMLFLLPAMLVIGSAVLQCPQTVEADSGMLTGIAVKVSAEGKSRTRVLADRVTIDGIPVRGRIDLTVYEQVEATVGQEIAVNARFYPVDEAWLRYDQDRGVASRASANGDFLSLGTVHNTFAGRLTRMRNAIGERIDILFPAHAEVAKGLLLGGAVSSIDEETLADFRETGTAHLLAVSGLHVGILTSFFLFSVQFVHRLPLRMLLLAVLLFLYAALSGFSASVLRASIMALIATPALPLGRRVDLASSLAFAFVCVLILKPFSLFTASFQLSFLAVAGFVLVLPLLKKPLCVLGYRTGLGIASSLSVIIATAPSAARFFGGIGFSAMAANLLMLPLVPFFLIPAVIALLFSVISLPIGAFIAKLPSFVLLVMTRIAAAGGSIALPVPPPSGVASLLYFLLLVILSPLCRWERRKKGCISAVMAALCLLIW